MLLQQVLFVAFLAIILTLLGSATAAPANITVLTAAARAKAWPAAPDVCSTGPYRCLVVETKGNRGFKNLWCPNFTSRTLAIVSRRDCRLFPSYTSPSLSSSYLASPLTRSLTALDLRIVIPDHVYAFNKGCEGNLALECLGKRDGQLHRGLTFFRFAPTSFFSSKDPNIKGVTSTDQIFASSPPEVNNLYVNVPWVDLLIECAWGP